MRLAASNIAWDTSEDEIIARLLKSYGVNAIDIVPGKYFPDPFKTSCADTIRIKQWWMSHDIEITGMQALLSGAKGLNLFDSSKSRHAMLEYLTEVCRIGAMLGATRLVFGSPRNRNLNGLLESQAIEIAIPFFRQLGSIAQSFGVVICIEPNPSCYGADFMTTSMETAKIVREVAHAGIRMQLDTGAIIINEEDVHEVLQNCASLIEHIHVSEPNLVPLGEGRTNHAKMAEALRQQLPNKIVSIEMLATKDESHLLSLERALVLASRYYRGATSQVS